MEESRPERFMYTTKNATLKSQDVKKSKTRKGSQVQDMKIL